MNHLLILLFLPIIVTGSFAISLARRTERDHAADCARPFQFYLVFLNILAVVYLTAKYTFTNVSAEETPNIRQLAHAGVALGSFVAMSGAAYWLLRTAFAMRMRDCPSLVIRLYGAGISILGLNCIVGIGLLFAGRSHQWLMTNNLIMVLATTLLCCVVSIWMIVSRDDVQDQTQRSAVRRLGVVFLIGYAVFFISFLFPRSWHLALTAIFLLWLNVSALHWFRTRAHHFFRVTKVGDITQALDDLAARYAITRREREVMELLYQGKSYKEIEDLLCISLGTVKNHAYNMYRKLGINSRAELIHMAIGSQTTV